MARATVATIAKGRHPPAPIGAEQPTAKKVLGRCPKCGYKVLLPCWSCTLEELLKHKPRRPFGP